MKKSQKRMLTQGLMSLFLLLALGIWYGLKILPSLNQKSKAGKVLLIKNTRPSDLNSIELTIRQKDYTETTVLSNTRRGWVMVKPIHDKLDPDMLSRLLDNITNLQTERVFTNVSSADLKGYGLDNPSDRFVFHYKNGKQKILINGDLATTENYYYTLADNVSNTVYLIYAYKFSGLERMSGELRNRTLWTVPFEKVTSLQLSLPGKFDFRAVKKDSVWTILSPQKGLANDFEFKKQMLNFFTLRILNFPPELKKNDRKVLEKSPMAKIVFTSENETNSLLISRIQISNQVLAFSENHPGIFILDYTDITNVFHFKPSDLLSNRP